VRPLLALLLLLALPSTAAAAARAELAGTELRVRDGDRVVLRGTPGLRALGAWHAATGVRERRADGAVLTTGDPQGRELEVAVDGDRMRIAVRGPAAQGVGARFTGRAGERYLGFGERSDAAVRTSGTVENFVAEGPYQPEERPFLTPFVPPWAMRPTRDDATYFPVPWLLSTAGYGVLVEGDETSTFALDAPRWDVEATGAPAGQPTSDGSAPQAVSLRAFAGDGPAEALRDLTAAIGRQPRAVPEALGPWYHTEPGFGNEAAILKGLQDADVPLSAGQIFTQYLPCGNHLANRARQLRRVKLLHDAGLAATTYINPMLCERHPAFAEAVRTGALARRPDGSTYTYEFSVRRDVVGQFDFSSPAGRSLFDRLVQDALDDGHDGWMEDYGEYTPLDAVSHDGQPGRAKHNAHPREYHCAAQELADRPLRYARSGWTGSARCSPVVWGGDPTTDWGYDGLASAVKNGLSMGLSGVSTWGSDIGGFFQLGTRQVTPELLKRWIGLGLVSGVMRAQETGIAVPEKDRPRVFEPEIVGTWRRAAKLRTQLHPYLAAADDAYQRTGLPIMRHLALRWPGDPRASSRDDELLFGPDLLAAPVLEPDARERRLYLPEGEWVDLWRAARFDAPTGALQLAGRAALLEGGRDVTVPAPLDEVPLLARAGTLLPLLPADVETLSEHGTDPGIVHLRDRRDRMTVLAFPRGQSTAAFNEGERLSSREVRGAWRLRIEGKRRRLYRVEASLATLRTPIEPCRLRLGRRTLPRRAWSYDREARVLVARFFATKGRLRVEACR
jgi:sulfoquinovosidase